MLLASTAYTFLAPPCSVKKDRTPGEEWEERDEEEQAESRTGHLMAAA